MVGLLAAGCDGGRVDQAGASSVFHLRTGECFHSSAGTAGQRVEVKDLSAVSCSDVHDGEVFAVVSHPAPLNAKDADDPAAGYPGDDAVADFAASECLERFRAYTGAGYDDSDLDVASVRPGRDSWVEKDDREVACVLYQKGTTLTGSRRKP